MARTRPWEVSDELWERVHPLIAERPPHPKGGRPAADDRQMFAAIVYVLRTGIQWNALPRELGASSTVYDRFRTWEAQGFFQRLWQAELHHYDELVGIAWDWQSVDSSTVKAPFAQAAVGPAPTDRGKQGTKRSLLCDRRGLPLALATLGANRHDSKLLFPTLDALGLDRSEPTVMDPQNLCLDAAYDYDPIMGNSTNVALSLMYGSILSTTNGISLLRKTPIAWNQAKRLDDGSWNAFSPGSIAGVAS